MDTEGMRLDPLEAEIERPWSLGVLTKLVYAIPHYHNPTGATLSEARRQRLVEIAAPQRVTGLENDAYGDLGYEGKSLHSLASLDRRGWVIATTEPMGAMAPVRQNMGSSSLMA